MQTNLMSEERLENKRYLRKVQDELHESQIEDALLRYACKVSPSHSIHEKHLLKGQLGSSVSGKQVLKVIACFIWLLQAVEERIYKEKQLEQERMAQELTRISYVKLRDEKMRQYIKENR